VSIDAEQSQSRLAVLHACIYAAGIVLLVAGLFGQVAYLLVLAGPCLAISGGLIWVGTQISLAGPVGKILRGLLGRSRVATMQLRAAFWVLAGLLVTLWGIAGMRAGDQPPAFTPSDPMISALFGSPQSPRSPRPVDPLS
jgi:hypothetical protein